MTASTDPRGQMVEIAQLMFTRFLTNSAGGNVSCRVDERIYVTPRYLGSKYHWKLKEAMVLLFNEAKLAVEPAGAASTAALCGPLRDELRGKRVGAIVCGSNIDLGSYSKLVADFL